MNDPNTLEFVPPPPAGVSGDVGELQHPAIIEVETDPLEKNTAVVVPLDRLLGNSEYTGMYWWRVPLSDSRGGFRQLGHWNRDATKRADGTLQCPDPDYLCLPTLTSTAQVATPGPTISRIHSASIFGVELYAGFEFPGANLNQETSGTNPVPLLVPGFAVPGTNAGIMCIAPVQVNGVPYLAVGYEVSGGGANTLQVISSISAFASSTVPVGTAGTCGVIQTPIDGSALLVYQFQSGAAGSGMIRAVRTDVGIGSTTVSAIRSTLNGGGAAVGLSAWEGEPAAYWLEPTESALWFPSFSITPTASDKARLVRTDLRGYLPSAVDVPLRWVTFATRVRGGIVVCDRFTHWFCAPGRRFKRMSVFDDMPANSDLTPICCGHATKNGRFLIDVNYARVPGGSVGTQQRYWMEWDFDLWEPAIVSAKKTTIQQVAVASGGGNNLPWSPYTGFVTTHTQDTGGNGSWYYQFQQDIGQNLWNLRQTSGAAAGSGVQFEEGPETYTTPALVLDGYEDCRLQLIAATGPRASLVAEGGSGAYVGLEELQTGATGLTSNGRGLVFNGTEPATAGTGDRAERRISWGLTGAWSYALQFRVTLARGANSHQSPNGYPIYVEGLAIRKKVQVPTADILRALDAQRGD